MALITWLLFLIFPSCQEDEFDQDSIAYISSLASSKGKPTATVGKVKDVDGNWYKTVKIGNQWWMAENLKATKYSNGDLIGTTDPVTLDILGESEPSYQWAYDGLKSNAVVFGRLYTWYAATDIRNVCPKGWHLPSDAEWTTLTGYIGQSIAGSKLKSTYGWTEGGNGTDDYGFSALPGGRREYASFGYINDDGDWWSSSSSEEQGSAWSRLMYFYEDYVSRNGETPKIDGFSVRCIKN
jgi:uncharacterized protein (TIGR02145 family)